MKSPTSIHPTLEQFRRLGISDVEILRRYTAACDDEPTVLTYVRLHCEEVAGDIGSDATPQLISDDEPTVPISRRRSADFCAVGTRPAG
jgi:hypothetical protein